MNKKIGVALILLLSLLSMTFIVKAGTYRVPSKDTSCAGGSAAGGICQDQLGVTTTGSNIASPSCSGNVGYVAWDLGSEGLTATLASAKLTFTTYAVSAAPDADLTFALVTPNNHTWTEGGTNPGNGTELATAVVRLSDGASAQQVVFQSDALGAYFDGLKGGTASVGVVIKSGCTLSTVVNFEDTDRSGGVASNAPDLIFYTGPGATAVTLASLTATGAAVPFARYALFAAIIGMAAIALAWVRRR